MVSASAFQAEDDSSILFTYSNSGVDWRWFQLGLISQITRVRVSPPQLNSGEDENNRCNFF